MRSRHESFSERHSPAVQSLWQVLAVVFLTAVALNYPWELAQGSLFTAASYTENVWLHCFVASLGDGVMVLLLFGFGWLVQRRRDWFVRPGRDGYALLAASGASLAVLVEWAAVHGFQRWTYADSMPRVPGLEIGLVPVLQMVVLPPIIFRIAATVQKRRRRSTRAG